MSVETLLLVIAINMANLIPLGPAKVLPLGEGGVDACAEVSSAIVERQVAAIKAGGPPVAYLFACTSRKIGEPS